MLLAHWRLFQAFTERLGDVPERCVFAIKQFVFTSALSCYLSAAPESEQGAAIPTSSCRSGAAARGSGTTSAPSTNLERANIERREDAPNPGGARRLLFAGERSRGRRKPSFGSPSSSTRRPSTSRDSNRPLIQRLAATSAEPADIRGRRSRMAARVRRDLGRVQRETGDEAAGVRQAQAGHLPAGKGVPDGRARAVTCWCRG